MSIRKKLFFLAIPFIVVFGLLEIVSRMKGYSGRPSASINDMQQYFVAADPYLGYRNRANGSFEHVAIRNSPRITTDEHGNRNGFLCPAGGTAGTVVVAGDSFMFGAELNDNETPPSEIA
jgi:hypothetical protein